MAVVERKSAGRVRPYDKLLTSTFAAVVAIGLAGYLLTRALPGSPALRCVGFVVFGTTAFIAGTVWWQVALAAIGHGSRGLPAHVVQSLGAIVGMAAALSAAEYALYAWTQNRALEAAGGIVASTIAFAVIGRIETRNLPPPAPDQVKRLRSITRMFVLIALMIVVDIFVGLRQAQFEFAVFRDAVLALEFATAPAVLVGAWFVHRRAAIGRAPSY